MRILQRDKDDCMSHDYHPAPERSGFRLLWPLLFLAILIGVLIWRTVEVRSARLHQPHAEPRAVTARGDLAEDEKSTIALFKAASRSVVHITTLSVRRDALSFNLMEIPQGTGSGFVWSDDGYIVTNFHVIQNAQAAQVMLFDSSTYQGELVGYNADHDLAVLKIDAPRDRLVKILVGTSSDLQVGQKAFAIGNPFGLDQTLTTGVISGLGREIESVTKVPIKGVIQTDAAINPGNSGGPLLDSAGRLIGMNTAIYSPSGAYAGIGFAVPVDMINDVVPQLIQHGTVHRAGLGVRIADDEIMRRLDKTGALVLGFAPHSAAKEAGMIATTRDPDTGKIDLGDIITAINQDSISSASDLREALSKFKPGDQVSVTVRRHGEEKLLTVALQRVE
jgi:S1-C subfamily serine protease